MPSAYAPYITRKRNSPSLIAPVCVLLLRQQLVRALELLLHEPYNEPAIKNCRCAQPGQRTSKGRQGRAQRSVCDGSAERFALADPDFRLRELECVDRRGCGLCLADEKLLSRGQLIKQAHGLTPKGRKGSLPNGHDMLTQTSGAALLQLAEPRRAVRRRAVQGAGGVGVGWEALGPSPAA